MQKRDNIIGREKRLYLECIIGTRGCGGGLCGRSFCVGIGIGHAWHEKPPSGGVDVG